MTTAADMLAERVMAAVQRRRSAVEVGSAYGGRIGFFCALEFWILDFEVLGGRGRYWGEGLFRGQRGLMLRVHSIEACPLAPFTVCIPPHGA